MPTLYWTDSETRNRLIGLWVQHTSPNGTTRLGEDMMRLINTTRVYAAQDDALFGDLDAIPWDRLMHAYGPATNAPLWIRALASESHDLRCYALKFLDEALYHQYTLYPATQAAIPYVIRILRNTAICDRQAGEESLRLGLLRFLQTCAEICPRQSEIGRAICEGRDAYVPTLDNADPESASAAYFLVAFCDRAAEVPPG